MEIPKIKVEGIVSNILLREYSKIFGLPNTGRDIVLFCSYSDFDIPRGHIFNEIFVWSELDDVYRCPIKLKRISQQFIKEFDEIPKGWKTISQFEFMDGAIPDIIYQLPIVQGWNQSNNSLFFR